MPKPKPGRRSKGKATSVHGDAVSTLLREALAQAEEKMLAHINDKYEDLKKFELWTDATGADFKSFISERLEYFVSRGATVIDDIPVTQPGDPERTTYHVVVLKYHEAVGGDQPGDIVAIELLFSDNDAYFIAFRPLTRGHREDDASGWFHFSDVTLPDFLRRNSAGEERMFQIFYDCRYDQPEKVQVGSESLSKMFRCYAQFTPQNCLHSSNRRNETLQSTMLILGEGQRFPPIQKDLMQKIDEGVMECLSQPLFYLIKGWRSLSDVVFHFKTNGNEDVLKCAEDDYKINLHVGSDYLLEMLLGKDSIIMLLKYSEIAAEMMYENLLPEKLKKRNRKKPLEP